MAEDLVDRPRDFAAFDMGRADVVRGGDERAGQRLDPVAMDDDEVGAVFGDDSPKSR